MTLANLRSLTLAANPDISNPLTVVRTFSVTAGSRVRAKLIDAAIDDGFSTFYGVGVSSATRMHKGSVPLNDRAESIEIKDRGVTFTIVELTDAGRIS